MPDLMQNTTAATLNLTLQDQSGSPIDLTACAVNLVYYIDPIPPTYVAPVSVTKSMTITNAKTGQVSYQFGISLINGVNVYDLGTPGQLHFVPMIVFSNGTQIAAPFEGQITVHPAF
jgi:hypothetical protein